MFPIHLRVGNQRGFFLIGLVIVLLIIAILYGKQLFPNKKGPGHDHVCRPFQRRRLRGPIGALTEPLLPPGESVTPAKLPRVKRYSGLAASPHVQKGEFMKSEMMGLSIAANITPVPKLWGKLPSQLPDRHPNPTPSPEPLFSNAPLQLQLQHLRFQRNRK